MDHHSNGRKKSSQCEVWVKLACSECFYVGVVAERLQRQAISRQVAGLIPANSKFSQFLNRELKTDF